jgi:WD40 repeat protein
VPREVSDRTLGAVLFVALTACSPKQAPEPPAITLSVPPPLPPAPASANAAAAAIEEPRFAIVPQTGHASEVEAVAYSPDGRFLATGGFDQTVRVWDGEGRLLATFSGHREAIKSLAWSPTSAELASGARDNTVRIWDLRTTKLRATLQQAGDHVAWSSDGAFLATCGYTPELKVWDAASGTLARSTTAANVRQLLVVAWSPDGETLATGSLEGTISTWAAGTLAPRTSERGSSRMIWSLAYNRAGTRLVAADADRIRVLDPRTGKGITKIDAKGATTVAWRPDGVALASWVRGGGIQIWDADQGASLGALVGPGWVNALAFSPDGKQLAVGGGGVSPYLSIWDSALKKRLRVLGADARVEEVAGWDPHGVLLAAAGKSGGVEIWDLPASRLRWVLGTGVVDAEGFSWSPDAKLIATVGRKEVSVWDVERGAKLGTLRAPNPQELSFHLAWTLDGRTLFAGLDHDVLRWDVASRREKPPIKVQGIVGEMVVSPDGAMLAVPLNFGATVELWTLPGAQRYATIHPHNMGWSEPPAWSSFSDTLATAAGDTIELWDPKTGKAGASRPGHAPFAAPAWTGAGPKLAFSAEDHAIMVWDPGASTTVLLRGHEDIVRHVAWSSNGGDLVSSADDGTVRLWTPPATSPRATFPGHAGRVWRVTWHPNSVAVLSASLEVRLNRVSDGAALVLRSFHVGDRTVGLIHTDRGLFVGDAEALDQVLFREGKDLRTAKFATARELRKLLERPLLVPLWWSGEPLE